MRKGVVLFVVLVALALVPGVRANVQDWTSMVAKEYATYNDLTKTLSCDARWPCFSADCAEQSSPSIYWPAKTGETCSALKGTFLSSGVVGSGTTPHDARASVRGFFSPQFSEYLYAFDETANQEVNTFTPRQDVKVFDYTWCGESVDMIYMKQSTTPTRITTFKVDRDQGGKDAYGDTECQAFYRTQLATVGAFSKSSTFFYSGGDYYTFPTPFTCDDFVVANTQQSHSDWNFPITSRGSGVYGGSKGDNSVSITIGATNKRLTSIQVNAVDRSDNQGGLRFTVTCKNPQPVDGDASQTICTSLSSTYAWDGGVDTATKGYGCCGDDGDKDLGLYGNRRCQKTTNGGYEWVNANAACPGANQYDANGGCCNAANLGAIVMNTSNQLVCINKSATITDYVWASANTETASYFYKEYGKTTPTAKIVSDGGKWVLCGNQGTTTTRTVDNIAPTAANVPPTNIKSPASCSNSGPCTTRSDCNAVCDASSFCDRSPGSTTYDDQACSACYDACSYFPLTCTTPNPCTDATATCTNNLCVCPSTKVWNGTACDAPKCPDATYTYANGICTPSNAGTTSATLPVMAACNLTINVQQASAKLFVCAGDWQLNEPSNPYTFKSAAGPPKTYAYNPHPATGSDSICSAGRILAANTKYAPDRKSSGLCGDDQCYYNGGPAVVNAINNNGKGTCVPNKAWVLDSYCQDGAWTTRTRMLADQLAVLGTNNFIVHCDSVDQTINNPTTPQTFANSVAPKVNGFCVIEDTTTTPPTTVAVGTTLNSAAGISPELSTTPVQDPVLETTAISSLPRSFPAIINDARLNATATQCKNVVNTKPAESDAFYSCEADQGSVLYNRKTATLIFGVQPDGSLVFAPGSNGRGKLQGGFDTTQAKNALTRYYPLNPSKIYWAQSVVGQNKKTIIGVFEPQYDGASAKSVATVTFDGIDVTKYYTNYISKFSGANGRAKLESGNSFVTVNATATTAQAEWEYFTLQLRP